MVEGDTVALKAIQQRILGPPNSLQQNLRDAAACERLAELSCSGRPGFHVARLPCSDAWAANGLCLLHAGLATSREVELAEAVARDVLEFTAQIDYDRWQASPG